MMERSIYGIFFFFLYTNMVLAQSDFKPLDFDLWPIKGAQTGEGILYQPQDYINGEFNYDNLFITAKEGTEVVAPHSGTIRHIAYGYRNSLVNSFSFHINYNDSMDIQNYDDLFRKAVANNKDVDPKYLSVTIGLETKKGERYYISGLRPVKFFKTGEKIKKGQVIGMVGHSYHSISQPSISMSRSINTFPVDPMGVFGLTSSFVPPKSKIDHNTHLHPVSKLKEYFKIFKDALEEGHPGLYDYTAKEELDDLFQQTASKIIRPMLSEEFRILLLPIVKAIRDSHTTLMPRSYRNSDGSRPPVLFGMGRDSLTVFSAISGYEEFLKKRILSIDGHQASDLLVEISRLVYGGDGYIETLEKRELLLNFWKYFGEINRKKSGDKIDIEFSDGNTQTFEYAHYEKGDYFPQLREKDDKRFSVFSPSTNVAAVDINTFQLLETDIDSISAFVKQVSDSAYEHLIIDLRDNSGGSPEAVDKIFSLISRTPFRQKRMQMVPKKGTYEFFKYTYNYPPNANNVFFEFTEVPGKTGFFKTEEAFPLKEPHDNIHFSGEIYVLTNEYSKSAASVFAGMVNRYKLGQIIGREPGSAYHQFNATKTAQVFFGNAGFVLYLPLVKSIFDTEGDSDIPWGQGVIPDSTVEMSYIEFMSEDDPVLNAALTIIKHSDSSNVSVSSNSKIYWMVGFAAMIISATFIFLMRKHRQTSG